MRRQPSFVPWTQDVLRGLIWVILASPVVLLQARLGSVEPWWLDLALRAATGYLTVFLVIASLRYGLPAPRAGSFRLAAEPEYLAYLVSSTFAEVAMHPLVRGPFWFLHATRVAYLKILGADVAWTASFPSSIEVRNPALLTLGPGCQLESGVVIETALHGAGRVRVDQVVVGEGCLVGAHVLLMPGCTLGHRARIEPATVVGEGARVGVGATIQEGARLERRVDLGSYASVGTGAILSEGVRVGDRARVQPGAWVQADTAVPERETWAGVPARRLNDPMGRSASARPS